VSITEKKVLEQLKEDPETKIKVRDSLDYYVTLPPGYDKNQGYGVVFCVTGFGDRADSDYQMNVLRPYISDRYNVIAVGLRYHNDLRFSDKNLTMDLLGIGRFFGLDRELVEKNTGNYNNTIDKIFKLLVSMDITYLDPRFAIRAHSFHRYSSFGFLPAIEHLSVLYDINKYYKIDKKKYNGFWFFLRRIHYFFDG